MILYLSKNFQLPFIMLDHWKNIFTDIKADKRFLKSNFILCTETQIGLHETPDIDIDGFDSLMSNAEHKYSSLCMYRKWDNELTELHRSEEVFFG